MLVFVNDFILQRLPNPSIEVYLSQTGLETWFDWRWRGCAQSLGWRFNTGPSYWKNDVGFVSLRELRGHCESQNPFNPWWNAKKQPYRNPQSFGGPSPKPPAPLNRLKRPWSAWPLQEPLTLSPYAPIERYTSCTRTHCCQFGSRYTLCLDKNMDKNLSLR